MRLQPSGSILKIVHFTVVCLVTWPVNESEAGVDLVLIETPLLFLCNFLLFSETTTSLTYEKEGGLYNFTRSTLASLSFKDYVTKHATVKRSIEVENRQLSRWRHLTTTSRIQFVFLFLFKFCFPSGVKIGIALMSICSQMSSSCL